MSRMHLILAAAMLVGCHQSRPVTNTSGAVYSVLCASVAGTNMAQSKPTKITVHVSTELAAAGESVRSVAPMLHKNDGAGPHTVTVDVEVDPATIHCEQKQLPTRMWVNPDGDLSNAPSEP